MPRIILNKGKNMSGNENLMTSAMCLWEAALENSDLMARLKSHCCSAATCREYIICITPICEDAWKIAKSSGYDDCYDWEFCPRFLYHATETNLFVKTNQTGRAKRIADLICAEYFNSTNSRKV